MVLGALFTQKASGSSAPFIALLAYRVQMIGICGTIASLILFSSQITDIALPNFLQRNRLWIAALFLASLAFTPLVLHLPSAGTLV